jgi:hypothetical protein
MAWYLVATMSGKINGLACVMTIALIAAHGTCHHTTPTI